MMDQHQQALVSLLLGSFPNFQSGDAEAALAAYEIVMSNADERDMQPGVMLIINGQLPGHDGRFAPTAPQLAKAIRIALEKRVDAENSARAQLAAPKDDWVELSPETKARRKAMLDDLRVKLSADMASGNEEGRAILSDLQRRTNERFDPKPVTYSVGDPDAEKDMGNSTRGAA